MTYRPADSTATVRGKSSTASGTRAALMENAPFAQDPRLARLLSLYATAYQLAVRTLGTTRDAEDVVQVAYIKALNHLPADLPDAEVQPWFFRITVNAARDFQRSEMRRKAREADQGTPGGGATEPVLPTGVSREMLGDLQVSLGELEERHRMPLVLCYEQGLSQNEAAHILDMPPRTLSKYLEDGLELLRKKMVERGHTAVPSLLILAFEHGAPVVPVGLQAIAREVLRTAPQAAPATTSTASGATAAGTAKSGWASLHIGWKILLGVMAAGFAFVVLIVLLFVVFLAATPSTVHVQSHDSSVDITPDAVHIQDGRGNNVDLSATPPAVHTAPATPVSPPPANHAPAQPGRDLPLP